MSVVPYLMDINVAANYIAILVANRFNIFALLGSGKMQQRQAAIHAIGHRIPFKNIDPTLQVIGNGLYVEVRERGFRLGRLISTEQNVIKNMLKIIGRRQCLSAFEWGDHGIAIMQVVSDRRRRWQSVDHFFSIAVKRIRED